MLSSGFEPPTLPSANVLHVAKSSAKSSTFLDKDPVISLVKMKYGQHSQCIQDIGYDPFFVRYCTNQQMQTYKNICAEARKSKQKVTVCIDSTGSLVRKLRNVMSIESKHIFLHAMAVNHNSNQLLVAQILAESSASITYEMWLKHFHKDGAPYPDQIVVDYSLALLNAVVKTYSNFRTIYEYADALEKHELQKTLIRIDIAHFIKKYSVYLRNCSRKVRMFYLSCIGSLTKCTELKEAEDIIKSLILISITEKYGDEANTNCENAIKCLTTKIAGKTFNINIL